MTIASSSSVSGNLYPRNANVPQPYMHQPQTIDQMMAQMIANIGVVGPGGGMRMQGGGPGGMMFADEMGGMGDHNQQQQPFMGGGPFSNLFRVLGMPMGGVHGDAVFSQEDLDRVITQLMEQHQSGNAPGPASETAIEELPTKQIEQKDLGDNGKAECSICMDEVQIGNTVTVLPCSHWFHHDCIKAWLGEHDTCPHCRQGIMPKDEPNTNRPRQPSQAPLNSTTSPEYAAPQQMPGGFPPAAGFTRQESGSQEHPFTVPESPTIHRRASSTGAADRRPSGVRQQSGRQGNPNVFRRMRDAFGGNGSGAGEGGSGGGPYS